MSKLQMSAKSGLQFRFLGPLSPDVIVLEFVAEPMVAEVMVMLGKRLGVEPVLISVLYGNRQMSHDDYLLIRSSDIVWPYVVNTSWKRRVCVKPWRGGNNVEIELSGMANVRDARKAIAAKLGVSFAMITLHHEDKTIGDWVRCPDDGLTYVMHEGQERVTIHLTAFDGKEYPAKMTKTLKCENSILDLQGMLEESDPYSVILADRDFVLIPATLTTEEKTEALEQLARFHDVPIYCQKVNKNVKVQIDSGNPFHFHFRREKPPTCAQMYKSMKEFRGKDRDKIAFLYNDRKVPDFVNWLHLNLTSDAKCGTYQALFVVSDYENFYFKNEQGEEYGGYFHEGSLVRDAREWLEGFTGRRVKAMKCGRELRDEQKLFRVGRRISFECESNDTTRSFSFKYEQIELKKSYKNSQRLREAFRDVEDDLRWEPKQVWIGIDKVFSVSPHDCFKIFPDNYVFTVQKQHIVEVVGQNWRIPKLVFFEGRNHADQIRMATSLFDHSFYTDKEEIGEQLPPGQSIVYALKKDCKVTIRLGDGFTRDQETVPADIRLKEIASGPGAIQVNGEPMDNNMRVYAVLFGKNADQVVFSRKALSRMVIKVEPTRAASSGTIHPQPITSPANQVAMSVGAAKNPPPPKEAPKAKRPYHFTCEKDDEPFTIDFDDEATIKDAREALADRYFVTPQDVSIFFAGRALPDSIVLSQIRFPAGAHNVSLVVLIADVTTILVRTALRLRPS